MNDFKKQIADARKNVALVSSFGPLGGNLLDLGANIGEVAIRCAGRFERVFAVEAHPDTFSVLARRVADAGISPKVELIDAVVAPVSGLSYVISSPSFCATGATARATPKSKTKPANYYRQVPTVALTELLGRSEPRVVKMDIEGCEIECLDDDQLVVPESVRDIVVEFHGRRYCRDGWFGGGEDEETRMTERQMWEMWEAINVILDACEDARGATQMNKEDIEFDDKVKRLSREMFEAIEDGANYEEISAALIKLQLALIVFTAKDEDAAVQHAAIIAYHQQQNIREYFQSMKMKRQ